MSEGLAELAEMESGWQDLLEAVGVAKVEDLRGFRGEQLREEMLKANALLKLADELPSDETLASWGLLFGEAEGPAHDALAEDSPMEEPDAAEEVFLNPSDDLRAEGELRMAVPISSKILIESGVSIQAVPIAAVRDHSVAKVSVPKKADHSIAPIPKIGTKTSSQVPQAPVAIEKKEESAALTERKGEIKLPPRRGAESTLPDRRDERKGSGQTELIPRGRQLTTTVKEETNAGRSEHSRRFIRGVLYPKVGQLWAGSFAVILLFFVFPSAIISASWLIFEKKWWLFIAPLALLPSAFLYVVLALKPRCRICGQGIFAHKSCLRHQKAHHFPLIGYIVPTAFHMILFRWFRCIYCGTAVRLKE